MSDIRRTKEHKRISREVVDEATFISRHKRENILIGLGSATIVSVFYLAAVAGGGDSAPLQRQVDQVNECTDESLQSLSAAVGDDLRMTDVIAAINLCETREDVQLSDAQFEESKVAIAAAYGLTVEG